MLLLGVGVEGGVREVCLVAVFASVVTAFDVVLAASPTTHLFKAVLVALEVAVLALAQALRVLLVVTRGAGRLGALGCGLELGLLRHGCDLGCWVGLGLLSVLLDVGGLLGASGRQIHADRGLLRAIGVHGEGGLLLVEVAWLLHVRVVLLMVGLLLIGQVIVQI